MSTQGPRPSVSVMEQDLSEKSGYLDKRSHRRVLGVQAWQKRYFRQEDRALSYFETDEHDFPMGFIPVSDMLSCHLLDEKGGKFAVVVPERIYTLRASSRQEAQEWVDSIKRAMANSATISKPSSSKHRRRQTPTFTHEAREMYSKVWHSLNTDAISKLQTHFFGLNFSSNKAAQEDETFQVLLNDFQTDERILSLLLSVLLRSGDVADAESLEMDLETTQKKIQEVEHIKQERRMSRMSVSISVPETSSATISVEPSPREATTKAKRVHRRTRTQFGLPDNLSAASLAGKKSGAIPSKHRRSSSQSKDLVPELRPDQLKYALLAAASEEHHKQEGEETDEEKASGTDTEQAGQPPSRRERLMEWLRSNAFFNSCSNTKAFLLSPLSLTVIWTALISRLHHETAKSRKTQEESTATTGGKALQLKAHFSAKYDQNYSKIGRRAPRVRRRRSAMSEGQGAIMPFGQPLSQQPSDSGQTSGYSSGFSSVGSGGSLRSSGNNSSGSTPGSDGDITDSGSLQLAELTAQMNQINTRLATLKETKEGRLEAEANAAAEEARKALISAEKKRLLAPSKPQAKNAASQSTPTSPATRTRIVSRQELATKQRRARARRRRRRDDEEPSRAKRDGLLHPPANAGGEGPNLGDILNSRRRRTQRAQRRKERDEAKRLKSIAKANFARQKNAMAKSHSKHGSLKKLAAQKLMKEMGSPPSSGLTSPANVALATKTQGLRFHFAAPGEVQAQPAAPVVKKQPVPPSHPRSSESAAGLTAEQTYQQQQQLEEPKLQRPRAMSSPLPPPPPPLKDKGSDSDSGSTADSDNDDDDDDDDDDGSDVDSLWPVASVMAAPFSKLAEEMAPPPPPPPPLEDDGNEKFQEQQDGDDETKCGAGSDNGSSSKRGSKKKRRHQRTTTWWTIPPPPPAEGENGAGDRTTNAKAAAAAAAEAAAAAPYDAAPLPGHSDSEADETPLPSMEISFDLPQSVKLREQERERGKQKQQSGNGAGERGHWRVISQAFDVVPTAEDLELRPEDLPGASAPPRRRRPRVQRQKSMEISIALPPPPPPPPEPEVEEQEAGHANNKSDVDQQQQQQQDATKLAAAVANKPRPPTGPRPPSCPKPSDASVRRPGAAKQQQDEGSEGGKKVMQPGTRNAVTGFMMKQGAKVKTWKRRWFVMHGFSIRWYAKPPRKPAQWKQPKGSFSLLGCRVEKLGELQQKELKCPDNSFAIHSCRPGKRVLILSAESALNRRKWLGAINQQLVELRTHVSTVTSQITTQEIRKRVAVSDLLVEKQTHKFQTYRRSVSGSQLVDWMVAHGYVWNTEEALALGNLLLSEGGMQLNRGIKAAAGGPAQQGASAKASANALAAVGGTSISGPSLKMAHQNMFLDSEGVFYSFESVLRSRLKKKVLRPRRSSDSQGTGSRKSLSTGSTGSSGSNSRTTADSAFQTASMQRRLHAKPVFEPGHWKDECDVADCSDCISAVGAFADYIRPQCGGSNWDYALSNKLLRLMITPARKFGDSEEVSADGEVKCMNVRVRNPLWEAVFKCLHGSDLHARVHTLQMLNALLLGNAARDFNCASMIASGEWRQWLLPLLSDIKRSLPDRLQEKVFLFVMNLFAVLHHHCFTQRTDFTEAFRTSYRMAIECATETCFMVPRTMISSTLSRIIHELPAKANMNPGSAQRLHELTSLCKTFIFFAPTAMSRDDDERQPGGPLRPEDRTVVSLKGWWYDLLPQEWVPTLHWREGLDGDQELITKVLQLFKKLGLERVRGHTGSNEGGGGGSTKANEAKLHEDYDHLPPADQAALRAMQKSVSFFTDAAAFLAMCGSRTRLMSPAQLSLLVQDFVSAPNSQKRHKVFLSVQGLNKGKRSSRKVAADNASSRKNSADSRKNSQ